MKLARALKQAQYSTSPKQPERHVQLDGKDSEKDL
jgi:hypothetical protein